MEDYWIISTHTQDLAKLQYSRSTLSLTEIYISSWTHHAAKLGD